MKSSFPLSPNILKTLPWTAVLLFRPGETFIKCEIRFLDTFLNEQKCIESILLCCTIVGNWWEFAVFWSSSHSFTWLTISLYKALSDRGRLINLWLPMGVHATLCPCKFFRRSIGSLHRVYELWDLQRYICS